MGFLLRVYSGLGPKSPAPRISQHLHLLAQHAEAQLTDLQCSHFGLAQKPKVQRV